MTPDELVKLLREKVEAEGGQERFAQKYGITRGYVSAVLCGHHKPGPGIALVLGFKKVVSFEPIK